MNRRKLEIVYSIGIIIAIPIIVTVNTITLTQSTNQAFNVELRRKADLANSIIAQSSLQLIQKNEYENLQKNLEKLESTQPTIMHSTIIKNIDNKLELIAKSPSAPKQLSQTAETKAKLVNDRRTSIAELINTHDRNGNSAQAWNVTTPLFDNDNNVIAVISTSFLTVDAQEAINNAFQKSFIILIISDILIILLLFRHFRLVGYIKLLAKQRELNQTLNDFLSVATHELKAPTSIIKGYLSIILDGDLGPINSDIKKQIDVAMSQTDRLNSLVQDLLNVSRIDQGKVQYNFTEVDTTKILNMIIENYQPIAKEKNLQIIYEPTNNIPLVRADEGRVQEIFTNIIDNAIKYTSQGSVTITQQQEKGFIIINFRDTGFGISPVAKDRLFQRFYRVKTSQTEGISGTGLGLWIIKQYIEAMNGLIDVETMEGVGSNFIIKLQINK